MFYLCASKRSGKWPTVWFVRGSSRPICRVSSAWRSTGWASWLKFMTLLRCIVIRRHSRSRPRHRSKSSSSSRRLHRRSRCRPVLQRPNRIFPILPYRRELLFYNMNINKNNSNNSIYNMTNTSSISLRIWSSSVHYFSHHLSPSSSLLGNYRIRPLFILLRVFRTQIFTQMFSNLLGNFFHFLDYCAKEIRSWVDETIHRVR